VDYPEKATIYKTQEVYVKMMVMQTMLIGECCWLVVTQFVSNKAMTSASDDCCSLVQFLSVVPNIRQCRISGVKTCISSEPIIAYLAYE